MARRVLPVPPGPVSVSSRTPLIEQQLLDASRARRRARRARVRCGGRLCARGAARRAAAPRRRVPARRRPAASCVSSASTSAAVGRAALRLPEHRRAAAARGRGGMSGARCAGLGTRVGRDGVKRAERRLRLERVRAGRQLVEDDAEREHVAGARRGLAARLLGRHVARRAENQVGIGAGVVVRSSTVGRSARRARPKSSTFT